MTDGVQDDSANAGATAAVGDAGSVAATAASGGTASTILDTSGTASTGGTAADATASTKPGDWPDNWRQLYAGDDAKLLKQMERYSSPKAALDSLIALKTKVSKGEVQKVLGDNPTEDELKEWRSENGIPEKASDYKLELGDGRVIGEQDKPLVDNFLEKMHLANAKPEIVNGALQAYYDIQDEAVRQREASDAQFTQESTEALIAEYGGEYRRNIQAVRDLFSIAPEAVREKIYGARLADGKVFASSPDVIRFFVELAREVNPMATLVPGAQGNAATAVADEITTIERMMRDDPPGSRDRYFKDEKTQARYRDLISGQQKMQKRA